MALWIPWAIRKTDKWVLQQIKPETFLDTKVTEWKLSYFRHIMRKQGFLQKTIILRKIEGSRKRGDQR